MGKCRQDRCEHNKRGKAVAGGDKNLRQFAFAAENRGDAEGGHHPGDQRHTDDAAFQQEIRIDRFLFLQLEADDEHIQIIDEKRQKKKHHSRDERPFPLTLPLDDVQRVNGVEQGGQRQGKRIHFLFPPSP